MSRQNDKGEGFMKQGQHVWNGEGRANRRGWSNGRSVLLSTLMALLLPWMASGAFAGVGATTSTFSYTGNDQSFTVPAGVTSLTVKLWGAGGAGGGYHAGIETGGKGGSGAFVTGTLAVTPGEILTLVVAGGGNANGSATYGGGAGAGLEGAGSGGGRSAIRRALAEVVTAGGGGGGSTNQTDPISANIPGGAGGLTTGSSGADGTDYDNTGTRVGGGGGGTQASGGAGGAGAFFGGNAGTAGSMLTGGSGGNVYGGGGGGGYFGGGGGGGSSGLDSGGGGGGGSSFLANLTASGGSAAGSADTPGGTADADYVAGIGTGGVANGNGGNGRIVLSYTPTNAPIVVTSAANNITATGATLYASLNPKGFATTAKFQYGTTTSYGSEVSVAFTPNDDSTDHAVSANISGLSPNTLYHFRAVATNSEGTTNGGDLTFTTAPAVTQQPTDQSVPKNTTATFRALSSGMRTRTGPSQLSNDQSLLPNECMISPNGGYELLYQTDGNLVLRDAADTILWASNTSGTTPKEAKMQSDGNFVVYDSAGTARFASGTGGNPGAVLKLQNDGNLVIYTSGGSAIWSTGTGYSQRGLTSDPVPTTQWQVSTDNGATFTNITGATLPVYSFTAVLADNNKQYRAIFTNSSGASVTSNAANLTVRDVADVTASGDPVTAIKNSNEVATEPTDYSGSEGPDKAIDNLSSSKYLNFTKENSGLVVTPQVGATLVTDVRFATANDAPERDPLTYQLQGSNNFNTASPNPSTATWTTIASGSTGLDLDPGRNVAGPAVSFSNLTYYKSYKLIFPTLRNSSSANSMQVAEIELIGVAIPADTAQNGPNFVVNSTAATDDGTCGVTNCTLREAINAANANANANNITFDGATFASAQTINLGSGLIISNPVTITGTGARLLTVRANSSNFIVFSISSGTVKISGMTISNAQGVQSSGDVTLDGVTVSGASASFFGAVHNVFGIMTILNSTISNNACIGLIAEGTTSVSNTTISGNNASGSFCGVFVGNAPLNLDSVTVTNNRPGGIRNIGGTVNVRNTIVAGNGTTGSSGGTPADIFGAFVSQGNNLIGTTTGGTGFTQPSDKTNVAANIGALANNGGPTDTHALLTNSPAIDAGDTTLTNDQRGVARPQGSADDIGAYEVTPPPTLGINNVTANEGNPAQGIPGTTDFVFTVTRSGDTSGISTVQYATADDTATAGSDYTAKTGTLTFPANDTAAQTFTVTITGDQGKETNETFNVTLSAPTNATITTATGIGTITNDDSAPVASNFAASTWAGRAIINRPTAASDSNGDTLTYSMGTTLPTLGTVGEVLSSDGLFLYTPNNSTDTGTDTFTINVSDGANTTPLTVTVTIGAAPAAGTLIYTSVGASDANAVGATSFANGYTSLLLGKENAMYGAGTWALSNRGVNGFTTADLLRSVGGTTALALATGDNPRAVTLWIGPNDVKNFAFAHFVVPPTEPEIAAFLTQFNSDYTAVLTALKGALTGSPAGIVTANIPKIGNLPAALVFSAPQRAALNDLCRRASDVINAAAVGKAPVLDLYTSSDSAVLGDTSGDGFHPSNQGYAKLADGFWTLLRPQLNRKPVADAQTLSTPEGTDLNGTLTASDPDLDEGALTLTVNQPATGKGSVVFNAADNTFTYSPPNADYNGDGSFTFTASNSTGTSDAATITVTVTAVNDAPSFTKGADQTVVEDAGAQTVNNWATALSAGPADEAGQTLDFLVSNNNNALFSVQPAIDANGTLSYTTAAEANGSATVSVQIHDNGGTANGGVNTSATQTFTISVTPALTISITTPSAGASLTDLSGGISGTAQDNQNANGIQEVRVVLHRLANGAAQYWTGSAWSSTSTYIVASLTPPGGFNVGWSLAAGQLPAGADLTARTYYLRAWAYDHPTLATEFAYSGQQTFTIGGADTTAPLSVVIGTPAAGATVENLSGGISGSAQDNAGGSGLNRVLLILHRYVSGTAQYWNGSAWVGTAVYLNTTLSSPGGLNSNWALPSNKVPGAADLPDNTYYLRAFAYDDAGNSKASGQQSFKVADLTAPLSVVIVNPTPGSTVEDLIGGISGTAEDDASGSGIKRVLVILHRRVGSVTEYWNGNAWTTTPKYLATTLVNPNAISTGWSLPTAQVPGGTNLPDNTYYLRAYAYDQGNLSLYSGQKSFVVQSTTPVQTPSSLRNGVQAVAWVSSSRIELEFTGAVPSGDFAVTINGQASGVQSVERAGKTVTLLLEEGVLKAGDKVGISWKGGEATASAE